MNPKKMRKGRSKMRIKQERTWKKRMSSTAPSQSFFSTFDSNSSKKNTIPGYEKRDFPIAAVLSMEGYTCQNDVMFVS